MRSGRRTELYLRGMVVLRIVVWLKLHRVLDGLWGTVPCMHRHNTAYEYDYGISTAATNR